MELTHAHTHTHTQLTGLKNGYNCALWGKESSLSFSLSLSLSLSLFLSLSWRHIWVFSWSSSTAKPIRDLPLFPLKKLAPPLSPSRFQSLKMMLLETSNGRHFPFSLSRHFSPHSFLSEKNIKTELLNV